MRGLPANLRLGETTVRWLPRRDVDGTAVPFDPVRKVDDCSRGGSRADRAIEWEWRDDACLVLAGHAIEIGSLDEARGLELRHVAARVHVVERDVQLAAKRIEDGHVAPWNERCSSRDQRERRDREERPG